jgi:hypothetical protein
MHVQMLTTESGAGITGERLTDVGVGSEEVLISV